LLEYGVSKPQSSPNLKGGFVSFVWHIFAVTLLAVFFSIASIVLLEILEVVFRVNIPQVAVPALGASMTAVAWVVISNRSKNKRSNRPG
jgi:hypothetical protein